MDSAVPDVLPFMEEPVATSAIAPASSRLHGRDFLILIAFCLALFGYEMFSGRALSLHEARLPELSREMFIHHNWLFPQSGGRPWLERPPLPQWIEVGTSMLLGRRCDAVWVVRLPSVLMGLSIVLMTAWAAAVWFGRGVGLLSGLVLATMYEFYAYSVLAEDDIYLAAVVALGLTLFIAMEFASRMHRDERAKFFGNRPWQVWAFFFLLGLMNIVKSPLLGPAVVVGPVGAYLLLSGDWLRIRRYVWFWGSLLFAFLLVSWTLAAAYRYPDVIRNWRFDYADTTQYDQKFWYYAILVLPAFLQPWILASITGFIVTSRAAIGRRTSGERFLWCWAILPVILLSIPHRKHHHYFVPSIAPWAILSAVGISIIWRDLTKPRQPPMNVWPIFAIVAVVVAAGVTMYPQIVHRIFHSEVTVSRANVLILGVIAVGGAAALLWGIARRQPAIAAGACFIGVAAAYCWGQSVLPDIVTQDTAFLHRVDREVPKDEPLYVNSDLAGEMDFFRNQFYLRPSAILLHNLTYLRDQRITVPQVWIVTRHRDLDELEAFGQVEVRDESTHTRRERGPQDRFTLFHLRFRPGLSRYPAPPYINTLQAMGRQQGPYCGPPPDKNRDGSSLTPARRE
jgi:4-amino-4-deoxy-L-arabinose transferase-like glycosyltransferase